MFGDNKPQKYRNAPNPYLHATRDDALNWYLRGIKIVSKYIKKRGGGDVVNSIYIREDSGKQWEASFQSAEAMAEGEFLKLIDRRKYPKLHQKYLAHVSAALAMPTLDIFMGIQETMRQCGGTSSILMDGYSDADGFNDDAAFNFLNRHLTLANINSVRLVTDSDDEPLCQAADLVAYGAFRLNLADSRQVPVEAWVQQTIPLLQPQKLCSLDIPRWLQRQRQKPDVSAVYNAARYAIAHHELKKYAPRLPNGT